MTINMQRVNEVYDRLALILKRPATFGLGATVPQPLAETIERLLLTLGQINVAQEEPVAEENLEEELSQDADRFAGAVN
jgi:hypothetical protein